MRMCTIRRHLSVVLAAALVAGSIATALADGGGSATLTISAGGVSASESDSGSFTFETSTLAATDTTTTMTLGMTVTDLRGTGAGWEVFASMEPFTYTTAETCGTATLDDPNLISVSVVCAHDSTCMLPNDSDTCGVSPGTPLSDIEDGFSICQASSGGMGSMLLTPTLTIPILANDFVGTYATTVLIGIES